MKIYAAPMEGITTWGYRQAFRHWFGGVDRFFTPFLNSENLSERDRREVSPERNQGISLVPQILSHTPEIFLKIQEHLAEYGYREVNLNLGCSSGTVTAKKRGAGALQDLPDLKKDLDEIFQKSSGLISVKTRIGYDRLVRVKNENQENLPEDGECYGEWQDILDLYRTYPLSELIVHPRTGKEFYRGRVHREAFRMAAEQVTEFRLIYNGDLCFLSEVQEIEKTFPKTASFTGDIMLGRGLIANPFLAEEIRGKEQNSRNPRIVFRNFHQELFQSWTEEMQSEGNAVQKMKEYWHYWAEYRNGIFPLLLTGGQKKTAVRLLKNLRKARRAAEYLSAAGALISLLPGEFPPGKQVDKIQETG